MSQFTVPATDTMLIQTQSGYAYSLGTEILLTDPAKLIHLDPDKEVEREDQIGYRVCAIIQLAMTSQQAGGRAVPTDSPNDIVSVVGMTKEGTELIELARFARTDVIMEQRVPTTHANALINSIWPHIEEIDEIQEAYVKDLIGA